MEDTPWSAHICCVSNVKGRVAALTSRRRRRTKGRDMSREASLRVLFNLYQKHRHQLTPAQRRTAKALLREARAGTLTRARVMAKSNAFVAGTGLTPAQAWRRLRFSPYYRHVLNVLAD